MSATQIDLSSLVTSIVALLTVAALLTNTYLSARAAKINNKKTGAEADAADADESRANAIKTYDETVNNLLIRQGEQGKEINDLRRIIDAANSKIEHLVYEVELWREKSIKLQSRIDELEKEAVNYRTAISTLLHENGALKEWAERLIKQIMLLCPGVEPEPLTKKPRTNE
jgi:peptidoglycan hydrolase CwlO-like protein